MRVYVDLETRATVDLRSANVYRYVEDSEFAILMGAWSVDGGPVEMTIGHGETVSQFEFYLSLPGVIFVAHNAGFERVVFSRAVGLPVGEYLPAEIFHDTMAIAGEKGWPQSLGKLAVSLGAEPKDEAGTRLINLFCRPTRKGTWLSSDDKPEDWARFVEYCRQDVATLVDVDHRLGDWPTEEERLAYLADQAINDRGIAIDVEMARRAVAAAELNKEEQEAEVRAMTGVDNPGSQQQMMKWCREMGLGNDNLRKETVAALLESDLHPDVRRVLELRQELALVASKKFSAALGAVSSDGRLRGAFKFFGAHTGRWAGRGTQVHNLPREQFPNEGDTELAIADLHAEERVSALELKRLVRPMFVVDGCVIDYKSIEALVIAHLAGEEWVMQAFRDGRDVYVETASRMGAGVTRTQGKIAVLALGFAGGTGSLSAMGYKGTENEKQKIVHQWRAANPSTVRLWSSLENCIESGGQVTDHLRITRHGQTMKIWLPSGRAIHYHGVRWETYHIKDPTTGKPIRKTGWRYDDPKGPGRIPTYGGRLAENVTQAVARDLLAAALVRLEERGYRPVGHVHDEILVEGESDWEKVAAVMSEPPDWAPDLPVSGDGFATYRYKKA